ncbi:MAG: SH3 domain-containing protein [Devosia sp.]|nr:SH3 domain-containing protein [Devosia sp.]
MTSIARLTASAAVALIALNVSAAVSGELFTHANLSLHRGPGRNFVVTSTVPTGTAVTVLWCNGDADWCLVDSGQSHGWAPIGDLKAKGGTPAERGAAAMAAAVNATGAAVPIADSPGAGTGMSVAVGGEDAISASVSTAVGSVPVKLP